MNIPPDLSEKLWQLTESQDAKAIEAFLSKHPELKSEFQARSKMVSGIKGSRPEVKKSTPERFLPSPKPLSSGPNRWAAALAASVLVAGAVFATVGTLKYVENKTAEQKPLNVNQVSNMSANGNNNAPVKQTLPEPINNPPLNPDPNAVQPIQEQRAIDQTVTIVAKSIKLSSALNDIGIQAGIRLESAPGMPDPEITIDFRDVPAIQVLESLGQKFGFTASPQTQNSVLLIPARDPNSPDNRQLPGFTDNATDPKNSNSGLTPIPIPGTNDFRENIEKPQQQNQ